jgi:hypothetical protein
VTVFAAILLAATSLNITIWPNGQAQAPKHSFTLKCAPVGGTLPHRAAACRQLAELKAPFAPLRKDLVCTEIYGGPQKARVVGTVAGRPIWAMFTRTNGCEISRWSRISPWLVPPGGVT